MNKLMFLFNNYHTTLRLFLSHKLLTTTSYFICNNIDSISNLKTNFHLHLSHVLSFPVLQ